MRCENQQVYILPFGDVNDPRGNVAADFDRRAAGKSLGIEDCFRIFGDRDLQAAIKLASPWRKMKLL